jgi:hypothetical protein
MFAKLAHPRTAPGLLLGPLTTIIRSALSSLRGEEFSRLPLAQDAERNARMRPECRRWTAQSPLRQMSAERVAAASVAHGMSDLRRGFVTQAPPPRAAERCSRCLAPWRSSNVRSSARHVSELRWKKADRPESEAGEAADDS